MRNKIREQNLQDIKTAGPQSQVLSGVVVDRNLVQDAPLSDCTETIEGLDPTEQAFSPAKSLSVRKGELVTASKAIIEKEYQPRVIVSTTGPNPFNKLTDKELEEYRKEVERKQRQLEEDSEDASQQRDKNAVDYTAACIPPSTPAKLQEGGGFAKEYLLP
uniref:Uncharacterized protein n=2 Tax=Sphaerodactylus townsendi TaxID=933632 RepID=A0ACB8E6W2_9SAUR